MRLIDADKIAGYIEKYFNCYDCETECINEEGYCDCSGCEVHRFKSDVTQIISMMPTAYDVDDVAIELKKHYKQARHKAIKIVRGEIDATN